MAGHYHFVGDVVGAALARARKITARHRLLVNIPSEMPMIKIDPLLFEQVLFNLIDNAAKYAPVDSQITISGWSDSSAVYVTLADEGPGIPEADLERIFDSFYRVRKEDQVRAGTGLGLAICKGFIEAMGGAIHASNLPVTSTGKTGALFTIRMPTSPVAEMSRVPYEL